MANEISATGRCLWLYDSFAGLPTPTEKDTLINDIFGLGSIERYEGTMACNESEVLSRLEALRFPLDRCKIVKGFFSNAPDTRGPISISFAYIDFDFYQPILDALNFVSARMPRGGRVIVDDYGWFSSGVQSAVDEFVMTQKEWEFSRPPEFCGKFCVLEKTA